MSDLYIDGPTGNRDFELERKCHENVGHRHNYDHVTLVRRGRLRVWTRPDEETPWQHFGDFDRGDYFPTRKGIYHRLKALEDGTMYTCLFPHRDFDSDVVVEDYNGNLAAYE